MRHFDFNGSVIKTHNQLRLRFTQALLGVVQPPVLLAGTLKQHLETLRNEYPEQVEEIMRSLYVDDIFTGQDMADQG